MASAREWFQEHPFAGVLGAWGTLVGGTLAYVWARPLPLQLKIITARLVAQAGMLTGAASFGLAAYLSSSQGHFDQPKVATSTWKLRDYSVVPAEPGSHHAAAEATDHHDSSAATPAVEIAAASQLK